MINDLYKKISKIDNHFRTTDTSQSEKERLFSRIIKLNEEVGEVCEAVLSECDENQRQKQKNINLDAELADVLICVLLISHAREKDVWKEVDAKLKKQFKRFNIK